VIRAPCTSTERCTWQAAIALPGIVIDTDGLTCTYSKLKLHSKDDIADSRLRVEFAGSLLHAKIIEQRP
jgi:hypothetical protein